MRADGEIHLAGALGQEFTPETVLVSASVPLVFAPTGAASVHGLIKTLFPAADSPPGVLVPLTSHRACSSAFQSRPRPPGRPAAAWGQIEGGL